MAVPQSTTEPLKLTAGDSVSFVKGLSDFRASLGWVLKYELRGGAQPMEWVSTASGDSHAISVSASTTATYLPGDYQITGFAENSGTGERQQVYFNFISIAANAESAQGSTDDRTLAQKMLALIETVMLGKAGHDILESDVEGTRLKRLSPSELRGEYNFWLAKRNQELHAARVNAGGESQRTVKMIFTRPK